MVAPGAMDRERMHKATRTKWICISRIFMSAFLSLLSWWSMTGFLAGLVRLLLAKPIKLLCAGVGIGDGVQAVDDDRRRRIGEPDRRRNEVRGGLQNEPGGIGRPS